MALIEFAFVAPVLLLLIVGAMEYGVYFLKSMSSSRALSASTQLVMQNPTDPTNQTFANRELSFGNHKVCAKAFRTLAAAEAGEGTCAEDEWSTAAPEDHDGPYYVSMSASGTTESITGLFSPLLPTIKHNEIVKVNASSGGGTGGGGSTTIVKNVGLGGERTDRVTVQCPPETIRVGCTGAREENLHDTYDEANVGFIGSRPIEPNGCEASADVTSGREEATVWAICLDPTLP